MRWHDDPEPEQLFHTITVFILKHFVSQILVSYIFNSKND